MKHKYRPVDEFSHYQDMINEIARIRFGKRNGNQEFKCVHCHTIVPAESYFSHVQNRNHCPYCLWSRHLDLYESGDRLCACKGAMRPVALTVKNVQKKYVRDGAGELMLVHQCQDCGRIAINRIAADDRADVILEVYRASLHVSPDLKVAPGIEGVRILTMKDSALVHLRLWGEIRQESLPLGNALTV